MAPVFGPSPTNIDGITHLELDPEFLEDTALFEDRHLAEGHSGYHRFLDGTHLRPAALTNLAAVATDHTNDLEVYDSDGRIRRFQEELKSNPERLLLGGP